jgi:hypothetical protein
MTQFKLERDAIRNMIIKGMMPRNKTETLCYLGKGRPILFKQPLPECWTEQISKSFKKIANVKEATEFINKCSEMNLPFKEIRQMLEYREWKEDDKEILKKIPFARQKKYRKEMEDMEIEKDKETSDYYAI